MPVRPTMATLIGRVRDLIDDTGDAPTFSDQQIQDALDARRETKLGDALLPSLPGRWAASLGAWEADVVLQDAAGALLTPTASDPLAGEWTIAASAVSLSGRTYDLYAAAADLLEQLAMRLRGRVDLRSGTKEIKQSQEPATVLKLAERYRAQQRSAATVTRMSLVQSDVCA